MRQVRGKKNKLTTYDVALEFTVGLHKASVRRDRRSRRIRSQLLWNRESVFDLIGHLSLLTQDKDALYSKECEDLISSFQ